MLRKILFTIIVGASVIFTGCAPKVEAVKPDPEVQKYIQEQQAKKEQAQNEVKVEIKKEDQKETLDQKEQIIETKPEVKPEIETEVISEIKPEVKPETVPEVKPETVPEVIPEEKPARKTQATIQGYNPGSLVYSDQFRNYYNGACVPVSTINTMKILEATQGIDIIKSNESDFDIYKELIVNFKTMESGNTYVEDVISGLQQTYYNRGINLTVGYLQDNIFENIKHEIDNNRPLILGDYTPGIEHAFTVIGYKEDNTGKYVITFTGWGNSPYETLPIRESNQIFITQR